MKVSYSSEKSLFKFNIPKNKEGRMKLFIPELQIPYIEDMLVIDGNVVSFSAYHSKGIFILIPLYIIDILLNKYFSINIPILIVFIIGIVLALIWNFVWASQFAKSNKTKIMYEELKEKEDSFTEVPIEENMGEDKDVHENVNEDIDEEIEKQDSYKESNNNRHDGSYRPRIKFVE